MASQYDGSGNCRVTILKYCERLLPRDWRVLQWSMETDEVVVESLGAVELRRIPAGCIAQTCAEGDMDTARGIALTCLAQYPERRQSRRRWRSMRSGRLCSSATLRESGWYPFGYLQFKTRPRRRHLGDRAYGSCRRSRQPGRSSRSMGDRANRQLHAPRRQSLLPLSTLAGLPRAQRSCGSTPLARCCRSRIVASWRYRSSNVCTMRHCQPLARSERLRRARWCADQPTDHYPTGVAHLRNDLPGASRAGSGRR